MKLNKINTVNFGGTDIDRVVFNKSEMWNAWTYAQSAPPLILSESIGKPLKRLYVEGKTETGKNLLNIPSEFTFTQFYALHTYIPAGTYYLSWEASVPGSDSAPTFRVENSFTYLSSTGGSASITLTEPITVIYFYSNGYDYAMSKGITSTIKKCMLTTENTTEYEPYTESYMGDLNEETGKYDVPITVRGKNLLRRNRISTTASGNGKLVAKNSEITINSTAEDGNMGVEYDEATSATLTPGTYTFTYKYISGTLTQSKNALWLGLRKSDNNWFNNANGADAFGIRPNNYKTTMTCKYNVKEETKVCVGFVGSCIAENFKLSYQLEKGASATPYEPYQAKTSLTVSLDAPLHSGEGAYINAKIPTVKGTTIIEVNTSVPPAALKTYYKKAR